MTTSLILYVYRPPGNLHLTLFHLITVIFIEGA